MVSSSEGPCAFRWIRLAFGASRYSRLLVGAFELVEPRAQLFEQFADRAQVLFDAGDVRLRRRVGNLVVDVELVDDRPREVCVFAGHDERADTTADFFAPLDHHRDARGVEATAENHRREPRPLAELDHLAVVATTVATAV